MFYSVLLFVVRRCSDKSFSQRLLAENGRLKRSLAQYRQEAQSMSLKTNELRDQRDSLLSETNGQKEEIVRLRDLVGGDRAVASHNCSDPPPSNPSSIKKA